MGSKPLILLCFSLLNPDGHPVISAVIPDRHAVFKSALLENLPHRVTLFIPVFDYQGTALLKKFLSNIKERTVKIKTLSNSSISLFVM